MLPGYKYLSDPPVNGSTLSPSFTYIQQAHAGSQVHSFNRQICDLRYCKMCSPSYMWQHLQHFARTFQNKPSESPTNSSDSDSFAALSKATAPEIVNREDEPDHVYL